MGSAGYSKLRLTFQSRIAELPSSACRKQSLFVVTVTRKWHSPTGREFGYLPMTVAMGLGLFHPPGREGASNLGGGASLTTIPRREEWSLFR